MCPVGYHVVPISMWSYIQPYYNHVLQGKNEKSHKKTRRDYKYQNKVTQARPKYLKQSHKNTPYTARKNKQKKSQKH